MDRQFLQLFLDRTHFPGEAREALARALEVLARADQEKALDGAVDLFYSQDLDLKPTAPLVEDMAAEAGLSPYTVWLLFLIAAARPAQGAFRDRGIPEEVFWDTFQDMKYKALECQSVHGVWGCFVAFWYADFYTCDLVKLGRLEYENTTYHRDQPYEKNGIILKKGDPVKSIHIPSSGEPFDRAARLESYQKAYQFFREELNGGPLVCVCDSWLLYPPYGEILPPGSHIADFRGDFDIIASREEDSFDDAWRVFGPDHGKPPAELPDRTSLQRAFKGWLQAGKKTGEGLGVLVFDGQRIVNR